MNGYEREHFFAMMWGLRQPLGAIALTVLGTTLYTILMATNISTPLLGIDGVPIRLTLLSSVNWEAEAETL